MPDLSISALTAAAALDGTEVLPIAQATSTVKTTTQDIADLASVTSNDLSAVLALAGQAVDAVSNDLSNLISSVDVLSNRVSANSVPGGTGSVTSLELNSAVNNASARNTANASVHGLQTVFDSFSNRISAVTGGAGLTSDQVSALVHSVLSTEYSARTSTGGVTSVKGLQSAIDALSNQVSDVNTMISVTSAQLETTSAAASLADVHASVASLAVTSVDARVNTLSNMLSAVSALSVGVAANGLQSAVNALSNSISAVESRLSTVSGNLTSVQSTTSHLASIVSLVSVVSGAGTAVGLQSCLNAISARITGGGLTSDQTSAMIASVASTTYSARTSIGGATSVKGLQSAINALSLQISSLNSIVSNALSAGDVISANFTSVQSTVSHLASIVSLVSCVSGAGTAVGLQSVINRLSARVNVDSVTSAEYTSSSSILLSIASAVSLCSVVSGAGTADGLQSCLNAISARIAAGGITSAAATDITHSILTTEYSVKNSAGTSVKGLQSALNALAGRLGGLSVNKVSRVTVANAINNAALNDISGLTVSVSVGGVYNLKGMLIYSVSATTGHAFGMTFPAMTLAEVAMNGNTSVNPGNAASSFSTWTNGVVRTGDTGANAWSAAAGTAQGLYYIDIDGVMVPSSSGNVIPQARASVNTNTVTILAGLYLRAFRLN